MALKESKSETKMKKDYFDDKEKTTLECQDLEPVGDVMFAGQLMKAHPLYGCFMTVNGHTYTHRQIPDNLKVSSIVNL